MTKQGFTTRQVHADRRLNKPQSGAVHTSTSNSVLFEFEDAQGIIDVFQGKVPGHVYSRSSSPSVSALQEIINDLEGGVGALCFATGMAAISATFLSLFRHGDHLIVSQFLFGNTRSLMNTLMDFGVQISFVDVTDVQCVKQAYQPNTRAVFTETVANPVTQVADVQAIGRYCEERGLLLIVDNTMTPPPLLSAKNMKASLVVNSLTKYIAGHGNVLGGVIVDTGNFDWRSFSNIAPGYQVGEPAQWGLTQIKKKGLRDMGATLAPASAHSISIGLETLALRLQRSCTNALRLATFLESHAKVKAVYYPGLADHPQHFLAREHLTGGYGAILSLDVTDDIDPVEFLNQLKLVICATHLGDNRTLALPVAATIFHENGPEERARMGISETMIRVSVGIEDTDDLVADFAQALDFFA
ncbi:cystathionine gamma-synthase family protein [Alteromonas aestuariivivens]|uniref:Cystathionine gamma-synthase family protein n=1 Tax=Alteromonas aestuariivivens TaxID=1938339 RepID=A0A3D8MCD7_9ALTE|nr:cystathionine gamma-synthase family protein [Alteromonas aestuariivivens]RDV27353.1 cystathionine gamma-synthase family protein [Alteromonas aestuariivivens]